MPTSFGSTVTSRIPSTDASVNVRLAATGERQLHSVLGYNAALAVRYLKFYDLGTVPVVGTDIPILTLALPPSTAFGLHFGGHQLYYGLGYALTVGAADTDTAALTAGDILGLNVIYT
jgi:hypothetical protein